MKSSKDKTSIALVKMMLTIGSTMALAVLLKEYPDYSLIIAKSLIGFLINFGSDSFLGMLTTSQPEIITLGLNPKYKRKRHRGLKKYSRRKK